MEYENEAYTQNDFLKYGDMFAMKDNSYYYDTMKDPENYLNSIHDIYKNNISWRNFEYLLLEKKIKVVKKPSTSTFGWFWGEKSNINDDLLYTFDRYKEILDKRVGRQNVSQQERAQDNLRIYEQMQRREKIKRGDLSTPGRRQESDFVQKRVKFKNNYPKIIEIFKDFVMENDQQLNNLLEHVLEEKNLSEPEANDILIEEARRKYNFEKEKYNENVRNFSNLSTGMKEKTRKMGKNLDKFSMKLKPIIKDYNARNKARDESLKSKVLKEEKSRFDLMLKEEEKLAKANNEKLELERRNEEERQITKEREKQTKLDEERRKQEEARNESARVFAEEKRRVEELQARQREIKKANEEIEDLEYKIRDAQSKYSMNRAKLRKLDSRLKDLKKLEKRKNELTEKLREKNLSIEKRQDILKQKTELNEKLANIENLKDQVADLKSKIPDPKTFKYDKEFREYELNKFKKMNDASIRQKNALFRSLELEKIKQEIKIREEERYQQEQREKEELKQAKIVFLKEKKITERRVDELNVSRKMRQNQIDTMREMEEDLISQKKFLKEIQAMNESKLKEKKLEIEQKKLRTLELEKQKLAAKQETAEQQKLFKDSIERDIQDLESEKKILQDLSAENKKILSNTKKEISARQLEIEKNIKLNLESVKQRESKIFAEEAKIKLDVFQTLSDVKDQTAIKLDVENTLEDLKEEIIRKEDVSSLLSDTITQIAFEEISEVEQYNDFLESEIDFKKKLADVNLTQKKVLEILTEEKQSYINFLEETKSSYLKQIFNAKRDIIEKNIKIILTQGKENLTYVTSGMKFEIENLEKEKEISERKKDLAVFQNENFKKELKLRKQEIELLKTIRVKVLETERKTRRNEASKAISDIVKNIEETERDSDVREKLDEILDDVETKEISAKAKSTLFSLIDKIENKEIHDAAKEKLDFILGKIEVHDNIEESKKALDNILDKIEDSQIRQDVEEKLDEILDDVEYDDYDFLDEDDDLDTFLSNVKKHISGQKGWNNFQKFQKF